MLDQMGDESVCELLEVGLGMLARARLSEGLRNTAQNCVQTIVRAAFRRLKTLTPEDVERLLEAAKKAEEEREGRERAAEERRRAAEARVVDRPEGEEGQEGKGSTDEKRASLESEGRAIEEVDGEFFLPRSLHPSHIRSARCTLSSVFCSAHSSAKDAGGSRFAFTCQSVPQPWLHPRLRSLTHRHAPLLHPVRPSHDS
jgi:hypothetical protein